MFLSGCASVPKDPNTLYPAAYKQALQTFPGVINPDTEVVERFIAFLSDIGSADSGALAEQLYAEELYFSDTLMQTTKREHVVAHFAGLANAGTKVAVTMLNVVPQGRDVFLIWTLTADFKVLRQPKRNTTIGMTHLRFDKNGQAVLHQDFWDSGLGFYSEIPLLGSVMRTIQRRFAPD